MRILIAEGDFICRRLLQSILSAYGQCDIAVDDREVIEAFRIAHQEQEPYDLVFLDILLPENDGLEIRNNIRAYEKKQGITKPDCVKIIMSSVLDTFKDIQMSFQDGYEVYLAKPLTREKLDEALREFGLI